MLATRRDGPMSTPVASSRLPALSAAEKVCSPPRLPVRGSFSSPAVASGFHAKNQATLLRGRGDLKNARLAFQADLPDTSSVHLRASAIERLGFRVDEDCDDTSLSVKAIGDEFRARDTPIVGYNLRQDRRKQSLYKICAGDCIRSVNHKESFNDMVNELRRASEHEMQLQLCVERELSDVLEVPDISTRLPGLQPSLSSPVLSPSARSPGEEALPLPVRQRKHPQSAHRRPSDTSDQKYNPSNSVSALAQDIPEVSLSGLQDSSLHLAENVDDSTNSSTDSMDGHESTSPSKRRGNQCQKNYVEEFASMDHFVADGLANDPANRQGYLKPLAVKVRCGLASGAVSAKNAFGRPPRAFSLSGRGAGFSAGRTFIPGTSFGKGPPSSQCSQVSTREPTPDHFFLSRRPTLE